jgi:hypothetical protein
MALANSSLAIAADALAQSLQTALADILVTVDTPAAAMKTASELTPAKHVLNIFFYRVAASPVHAAQTSGQPMFLRLFALLTPFPKPGVANGEALPALRILGEAMRHFHETPETAVMTSQEGGSGTAYRLQVVPQAPSMEEINHIWTTQGSDLTYQLSAAYEFALLPVDPRVAEAPASEVRTTIMQVDAHLDRRGERPVGYDMEYRSIPAPRGDEDGDGVIGAGEVWTGPTFLPQMLAVGPDGPLANATLPAAATGVDLALAGIAGNRAEVRLIHRDAGGAELRRAVHVVTLASAWLDLPAARVTLPIPDLGGTATLLAEVRAADAAGVPLVPDRVGGTLTLGVGGP